MKDPSEWLHPFRDVVRDTALRGLLITLANNQLKLADAAFLNGHISEEEYEAIQSSVVDYEKSNVIAEERTRIEDERRLKMFPNQANKKKKDSAPEKASNA